MEGRTAVAGLGGTLMCRLAPLASLRPRMSGTTEAKTRGACKTPSDQNLRARKVARGWDTLPRRRGPVASAPSPREPWFMDA